MAIPARYRACLESQANNQLVVTIDTQSNCLLLYPAPEWECIEREIIALPSFQPSARRIQRLLIGHATELELDNSGRLLLPALLRDYAEIDKQAMLVGQGKKFEIWSDVNWNINREQWLETTPLETEWSEKLRSLSL